MADSTNVPVLSFPAILRNPGLNSRYAHLHGPTAGGNDPKQGQTQTKKRHRDQNEGKRWVRRQDNARFVGNPHIVVASKRDYALLTPQTQPTFPEPLPPYLPRSVKVPTANLPATDPASANAGRFSVSLKGMRRDLRRAGVRAEVLVRDVESEIVQWLASGGTVFAPDRVDNAAHATGTPVGNSGIVEVSRTPLQLVWRISDDSFARYVVHCCARYHEVVSFSKGTDEHRLTYLLRPNVTRPDRRAPAGLETPPVTDLDYSSNPDTDIDSDFVSDRELESDAELDHEAALSAIAESPAPNLSALPVVQEDSWSVIGEESDLDDLDSSSEFGSNLEDSVDILQPRLDNLTLEPSGPTSIPEPQVPVSAEGQTTTTVAEEDPDKTLTSICPHPLQTDSRRREWVSARSASSPSRSPARTRRRRRRTGAKKRPVLGLQSGRSFYDYLFM